MNNISKEQKSERRLPFALKAGHQRHEEQESLRQQYGIKRHDVVVVERKSRLVLFAREAFGFFLSLLRIVANVALCVLAVVGLMALIYPESRLALHTALMDTISLLIDYLGL